MGLADNADMEKTKEKKMSGGCVYILTNKAFPSYVKIGMTQESPFDRARELSNTSAPHDFRVYGALFTATDIYKKVESDMHRILCEKRVNPRREYFEMSPEEAAEYLELIAGYIEGSSMKVFEGEQSAEPARRESQIENTEFWSAVADSSDLDERHIRFRNVNKNVALYTDGRLPVGTLMMRYSAAENSAWVYIESKNAESEESEIDAMLERKSLTDTFTKEYSKRSPGWMRYTVSVDTGESDETLAERTAETYSRLARILKG